MNFQEHFTNQMFSIRDELLKKIVCAALDKEEINFIPSDCSRFELVTFHHFPGREFIGFDGNMIGEIVMTFKDEDDQFKAGWEFIPKNRVD